VSGGTIYATFIEVDGSNPVNEMQVQDVEHLKCHSKQASNTNFFCVGDHLNSFELWDLQKSSFILNQRSRIFDSGTYSVFYTERHQVLETASYVIVSI